MKNQLRCCFLAILFFTFPFVLIAQKRELKYPNGVPMNKGVWFSSLTLSANSKDAENDNQLFFYAVNQDKRGFAIRLDPGYVFKKNLAGGLGFLYGNNRETSLRRSSDGIETDYKRINREFALRPYIKQFIPLGKTNKFYVVVPTELQFGMGTTLEESIVERELTRSYKKSTYYGLEMRPGLLLFIVENFGFEVNVGAFGLNSVTERTSRTDAPDGRVVDNNLNLKINLLELSFGFAAYF